MVNFLNWGINASEKKAKIANTKISLKIFKNIVKMF